MRVFGNASFLPVVLGRRATVFIQTSLRLSGVGACLLIALCAGLTDAPLFVEAVGAQTGLNLKYSSQESGLKVQQSAAAQSQRDSPPRVAQAQRFLARRGWATGSMRGTHPASVSHRTGRPAKTRSAPRAVAAGSGSWTPVGPNAVLTPAYGLVSGRVSALALDPADTTGNRLYVGTTGGGVWVAQNAASSNASLVAFSPLTDNVAALLSAQDPSISIGALTVQPGGTGVILAGTGDTNDALDSYYGAGILRSPDAGNSWTLAQFTADNDWSFIGEGFAGFAWSSVDPQRVVAAVSQAYESTLVNAQVPDRSYEGLYYSADSGVTWNLATIADGGAIVQGPGELFAQPDGNAATSVVWNPVRQLFIAAVRLHGYYQSSDGITWTRLAAQPGTGLTAAACPVNIGAAGSINCPIFRGTLAVNPQTGDTFAWTVDLYNQDQGLWQDACGLNAGNCSNPNLAFARQWPTTALETDTAYGAATIINGNYTLALAAVPAGLGQGQDTWLLAGADDLWKCSLANGCVWRNTTNATACMSSQVAGFQHALAWNTGNPMEILVGNDSGLWRSLDAIGETGQACAPSDAAHFQNLNGGLGSLAEVESLAASESLPGVLMAGLGVNGTAGVKSAGDAGAQWPQILAGYGGSVAIDSGNATNWYVNNQNGVSIYLCSDPTQCDAAEFGNSPVVVDADVGGDGNVMPAPAQFLIDPLNSTDVLIATCRVWRGPANGLDWTAANAISPVLDDGATGVPCAGDALIRSIAALPLSGSTETVYVGMYGMLNGGANLPGHILTATLNPASASMPAWHDLTLNPVTNSPNGLNEFGFDISSIYIDSHDSTGNTVYVTVEGFLSSTEPVQAVYSSTDGGAHWAAITANLPPSPVNSILVDPQNSNTVYVATDLGVYFTTNVASCANLPSNCWSVFGSGLPEAPVVALSATSSNASAHVLTAGTYGRGIWQIPLWSADSSPTTVTANPNSLTFASQVYGTTSNPQTVTLTNTGTAALKVTEVQENASFSESDTCQGATIAAGSSCALQVTFTPLATGSLSGAMTIFANVSGGQIAIALSGTGTAAGAVSLTPASINFGQVEVNTVSSSLPVDASNATGAAVPVTSVTVTAPFVLASNSCGVQSLAAEASCQISINFQPTQAGAALGTLTLIDGAGTQTVNLTGTGAAPATDQLGSTAIAFSPTATGQLSAAQTVLLTNAGDLPLTSIALSVGGAFQSSNTCGTQLSGHATCTISVIFAPLQLGAQTGILTVSDALRTQTVSLTGTGVQPATLAANPAALNFGSESLGVAGTPLSVTIGNTGSVAAANTGFQISGSAATSFGVGANSCPASLAAGASCAVQVVFTPAAAGSNTAALTVSSSTLGVTPIVVSLSGAGQAVSGLNAVPAQLSFPATIAGASSSVQTVTVSNNSGGAATNLSLAVSGAFSLAQNSCGGTLAVGANCTVGILFAPVSTGLATGALTVSSASIANSAVVQLSGPGTVAAGITVTPATLSFPTTGVGQASSAVAISVANSGSLTTLNDLSLTVPAGFQFVSNNCATTLAPGAACAAAIAFAPTAAGAQTGSLTVSTSTLPKAASVPLQGMGFDFTVGLSGSGSQTVSAGAVASFTLFLTPLNGASGPFSFACGALPANALCSFNPPAEALTAGATGNVVVLISTGSSSSASRAPGPWKWSALPVVCRFALVFRRRKLRRTSWNRLVALAMLAFVLSGLASCTISGGGTGGAGTGSGPGGLTPAGPYTIPVTVTSIGVAHSASVTMTVD